MAEKIDYVQVSFRLTRDEHTKLVRLAARQTPPVKVAAVVRWLLQQWISNGGKYAA